MQTVPLQLSDVIYNAANQSFEALVTVHDVSGTSRYACAIDAPIDMDFTDAAQGLSTQALRRHGRGQTDSTQTPAQVAQRAGRLSVLRRMVQHAEMAETQPHAA